MMTPHQNRQAARLHAEYERRRPRQGRERRKAITRSVPVSGALWRSRRLPGGSVEWIGPDGRPGTPPADLAALERAQPAIQRMTVFGAGSG